MIELYYRDIDQRENSMNSLRTKIALIFSAVILIAVVLIGTLSYTSSRKLVVDTLGLQAMSIAEHALGAIDPAVFRTITAESGENDSYIALREELNEIREANGLKYLYTMRAVATDAGTEYRYVVDGMPEGDEDASELGDVEDPENIDEGMLRLFEAGEPQIGELDDTADYGATLSAYLPIKDADGQLVGLLGADFDADRVYDLLERNKRNSIIVGAIIILASLVATLLVAGVLVRPLRKLIRTFAEVAQGRLTVSVETGRKDEIGQLSRAFGQTVEELRRLIRTIQHNASSLNQSAGSLQFHIQETEQFSREMNRSMDEAAAGSQTQLQLSEETTRAIGEVAIGVGRIAAASSDVADLSDTAMQEAEMGASRIDNVVRQMTAIRDSSDMMRETMQRLNVHSQRIGAIADTIAAIASSTNILSLNAGIEASRAGDAGKGFAVVAGEIRKLAAQAAVSSEEIAQTLETVREDTRRAVQAMERNGDEVASGQQIASEAGEAFKTILRDIRRVTGQFADVTSTTEQLASGAEEVAASVQEVSEIARQASLHFDQAMGASRDGAVRIRQIADAVSALHAMAETLNQQVRKFEV